jgi:hypothetical protein
MSAATRGILRRLLLPALLGSWALAVAQVPPGPDSPAGTDAGGAARGQEAEPCEEPDGVAGSDPVAAGPEAVVEEDPAVEASADEVFTPGDEISEDYPIPLPSDI